MVRLFDYRKDKAQTPPTKSQAASAAMASNTVAIGLVPFCCRLTHHKTTPIAPGLVPFRRKRHNNAAWV